MHALVIGGTGMLADVSLWLVREGYDVSVIARRYGRMKQLIDRAGQMASINPLLVDYRDQEALCSLISRAVQKNGTFALIIAWVHTDGNQALSTVIKKNSGHPGPWRLFHVLGSRADPAEAKSELCLPVACLYRQVQLGFVVEEYGSRWLTHQEISGGVIDAIRRDAPFHLVGTLDQSEKKRPR
ncbi:short-chain dehydrogenase [Geobacillus subterraneus]|uniref:Short-chain dehydrogenase n=3 Tax=Geobacillus TaxID=129337 RepID=S6A0Q3_GEOG3|nr:MULTISPECIES: short-chain dehydrogenase [Geobacillus]AGT31286.1 short-chain dehydrogenase [Geobacillus genomosp. 3]AMX84258.1 short-chain dehydrogenase [Geobacillus subterraneus]KZS27152.1 short-chain dehydrogenase [Geobacillus subterraneus]OXB88462.1 short-chain dehydrogenase [Geobacillus uzenensis]QIZ67106.1 short-chain dehydrogenase [Geobacillus subterraneus]